MAISRKNKVLTDTPMLDEIVYNCKQIIDDGVILKDDKEADSQETESSMIYSDLYIASIEGHSTFGMFQYDSNDLAAVVPNITSKELYEWAGNNDLIPVEFRDALHKRAMSNCIDYYKEENPYYRVYAGLPPYDDPGIYLEESDVPEALHKYIDFYSPVHRQDANLIIALENEGVIDSLMDKYPDAKYLRYIGRRKISIYEARKAEKFAPLYVPECDISDIRARFQELLEMNRQIFLKFYYDEAYDYGSDYYQKFMIVMIILQTFADMVGEIPEYIIRKDVFDIRTIQYLFEASGVKFFPEIPIRYQLSLVRNLNKLIKYKSSDKCIIDIVSLFGFENIEIFKYYILKMRNKNPDGSYVFSEYKDPNTGDIKENLDECYNLKFLKVGINELADDAIKDKGNLLDYEEFTRGDQYWIGDHTEDHVRREILERDFNMLRTKYMSIKSVYSMSKYMFQMSYFLGMITNHQLDLSMLLFNVPQLNVSMNIEDAFTFMYALAHVFYGTEDKIVTEVDQTLEILGFNFDADLEELANHLWQEGVKTFDDMGITGWQAPRNGIFTFTQLMTVYTKNKAVYDHVLHEMTHASNRRIYKLYKMIYDALMITKINNDYYTIDDNGTVASSFAEYLEHKNDILYYKYKELISLGDDVRNDRIATVIYNVACCIEELVDIKKVPYIFNGLPAASIEAVKTYIMDIVNFFKSFKATIMDLNTVYVFDDKLMSGVLMIDDWITRVIFDPKVEYMPYTDRVANQMNYLEKEEKPFIIDRWYKAYRFYQNIRDKASPRDRIGNAHVRSRKTDKAGISKDAVHQIAYCYTHEDDVDIRERYNMVSKLSKIDRAGIARDSYSIRYV